MPPCATFEALQLYGSCSGRIIFSKPLKSPVFAAEFLSVEERHSALVDEAARLEDLIDATSRLPELEEATSRLPELKDKLKRLAEDVALLEDNLNLLREKLDDPSKMEELGSLPADMELVFWVSDREGSPVPRDFEVVSHDDAPREFHPKKKMFFSAWVRRVIFGWL